MWQRFTQAARRAVFYAQQAAERNGEDAVSTEHLLLGVLQDDATEAARVLREAGVRPDRIRSDVSRRLVPGPGRSTAGMKLAAAAKHAIDLAYDEARTLGHRHVGTEHLLLGVIREETGLGARRLTALGVTLAALREQVVPVAWPPAPVVPPSEPDPWERLSPLAWRAVSQALEETRRRRRTLATSGDLVLGLLHSWNLATDLLRQLGCDPGALVRRLPRRYWLPFGLPRVSSVSLGDSANDAIARAYVEAEGCDEVGTEHLLLGVVAEVDGPAAEAFAAVGVTVEQVRAAIAFIRREPAAAAVAEENLPP